MGNVDTRTISREFIFKFLYHLQMADGIKKLETLSSSKEKLEDEISLYLNSLAEEDDNESYANYRVIKPKKILPDITNIIINYPAIIETIKGNINSWSISKLNKIDLTILIIAVFEITIKKLSKKVVIDEAIKLAKKFSDSQSYAFINAVLDNISVNE